MTTAKWVNTGPDEGALAALLGRIAQRIPVDSIDELWIFPTRRAQGVESTVIVISAFHMTSLQQADVGSEADPDERVRSVSSQRAEVDSGPDADKRDRSSSPQRGEVGRGAAEEQDRRRVSTAHFTATRDRKGRATVDEKIVLHAVAPADAAGRVVEGVIRRLDDNLALPRSERVAGDAARWAALLESLDRPRTPPLTPAGGG